MFFPTYEHYPGLSSLYGQPRFQLTNGFFAKIGPAFRHHFLTLGLPYIFLLRPSVRGLTVPTFPSATFSIRPIVVFLNVIDYYDVFTRAIVSLFFFSACTRMFFVYVSPNFDGYPRGLKANIVLEATLLSYCIPLSFPPLPHLPFFRSFIKHFLGFIPFPMFVLKCPFDMPPRLP